MSQHNWKCIILRGPSASGKSTIAGSLRKQIPSLAVLEQDYLSEIVFNHAAGFKEATRSVIEASVTAAHDNGLPVLIEGILNTQYYDKAFQRLTSRFKNNLLFVYLDVPFESTLIRHGSRSKVSLFGAKEMADWYKKSSPTGQSQELVISDQVSVDEAAALIRARAGI